MIAQGNCVSVAGGQWCCPPPYLSTCAPSPHAPTTCVGTNGAPCGPAVWFPDPPASDTPFVLALGGLIAVAAAAVVAHHHGVGVRREEPG